MLRITHSQIYWSSFWISIWRIKQSKHPICLRLPFSISQVSSAFLSCRYKIYVEENSSTEYNLKILQSSGLFTTEMLSLPFHTPTFDQYHHYIEQFVAPTVYWDVLYGWNSCQNQRKHLNNKRQPTQPHLKYSDQTCFLILDLPLQNCSAIHPQTRLCLQSHEDSSVWTLLLPPRSLERKPRPPPLSPPLLLSRYWKPLWDHTIDGVHTSLSFTLEWINSLSTSMWTISKTNWWPE